MVERPELEILDPVVVALPVLVMDALARIEVATEVLLYDEPVLEDVGATPTASERSIANGWSGA